MDSLGVGVTLEVSDPRLCMWCVHDLSHTKMSILILIHLNPSISGGATQLIMGTALFPLFKLIWGGDETMAWRTVTIVPAVVAFSTGVIVILTSDDCPKGKYKDLKKSGEMPEISAAASFRGGAVDINTWLLFIQYACCFGVELTVNNAAGKLIM